MTITRYTYDGGSNGANVGTGGGITTVSGSPPTYSTFAASIFDFTGLGISATSTQWLEHAVPTADWSGSVYVRVSATPGTGSQRPVVFRTPGGAFAGGIKFHSDTHIQIVNSSNAIIGAAATTVWDVNDEFRLDWQCNDTGTDVEITLRIFKNAAKSDTTPTETMSVRTIPSVDIAHVRLGGLDTGAWTVLFDSFAISDTLEWIGPFIPPSAPLDTPVVTVTDTNAPTTPGGSDGTITITWPAVTDADHYEAGIAGGHDVTTGFTIDDATATSPHTYTGLEAGNYTVAVRAIPA